MSATNIAQCEQNLKSLEQSIKQIADRHQKMVDFFHRSQEESAHLFHHLQQSWSDVIMLFTWTDQRRSLYVDLKQDQD